MKPEVCAAMETRLVEYADGELPEAEAQAIRAHLEVCSHCRTLVAALDRSLSLTRAIWADGDDRDTHPVPARRPGSNRRLIRWAARAAAVLVLAIGLPTAWRYLRPVPVETQLVVNELTPEQLEVIAARAGASAQMLVAADYLAENGAGELAHERWRYLVDTYPETDAATVARSRLQSDRSSMQ